MPIDPSIIGNVMAPQAVQLPDVNAMMRTQTQGMENIYQIEAARGAQAKEDAKAQEDAAVRALLPAYAHAFKTGDLRTALSLAPAEYQDGLLQYVEALDGKPIEEIQAALTGSLVTSEVGRAFLENQARVATLGVQQGQLDVSRQDLALRRQKQALDARGEGEWKLQEAEDGFFWTNPRSRQVIPADVTGGAAPGTVPGPAPIPAPDVVTPRQPVPGAPATETAPGTAQAPAFKPKPKKEDSLNEGEGKSVDFVIRMIDNDAIVTELEKEGVIATDTFGNIVTGVVRAFPDAVGRNLADQLESALNAISPSLSPDEQRLARAQLDFVTAKLRSESGAEIKASEFPAEYRKYFASAGDAGNEKLLADKRRARKNAIEGMKIRAGKSGRAQVDAYFAEQGTAPPAATVPTAPAAPGASFEGFEVLGEEPDQ
jgi:hypothetical protein